MIQTLRTPAIQDIQSIIQILPMGSMILLDVDNTLITPKAAVFRTIHAQDDLIGEIKTKAKTSRDFEHILSVWRLHRKVQLVCSEWPALLKQWQKDHLVYGLTQMNPGPCGLISQMEVWRFKELLSLDLTFTPSFQGLTHILVSAPENTQFYRGFFMTGTLTKGQVIRYILTRMRPPALVLIDDLSTHIEEGAAVCQEEGVPYQGIHFLGETLISTPLNPAIIQRQKKALIEEGRWLEDEEALSGDGS